MNDLITINETTPLKLYENPKTMDDWISRLESEIKSLALDISTEKGRENIRSVAYQLARTKAALDKAGKDLGAEYREKINAINAERNRGVEKLQAIQDEARAPLTEWENAEKSRVKSHEDGIAAMSALAVFPSDMPSLQSGMVQERIASLPSLFQRDWQEFAKRATETHESVHSALQRLLTERQKAEAEAAELARLRAEEEARKQKEREDQIAAEAAAKAKADAEAKAKAEAELQAKEAEEALQAVIREKEAAVAKAKAESEAAAKRESEHKASLEKAERDRIAAAEAAAKAERDNIAAEEKRKAAEAAAREADKAHKAKINNAALEAIQKASGISDESAKAIVIAIAGGHVPNVKIIY